jgi:hypothetical protein
MRKGRSKASTQLVIGEIKRRKRRNGFSAKTLATSGIKSRSGM